MSYENSIICGSYEVESLGIMTLQTRAGNMYVNAAGEGAELTIESSGTAAMVCGQSMVLVGGSAVLILGGPLGSVTHYVGLPEVGAQVKLEPELITLSVGPPGVGSSILMTPESITLKVAETTFTLTAAGIVETVGEVTREATAEGHVLTAGTTVQNIGVEGIVTEAPMKTEEIEGAITINCALMDTTVDGMSTETASVKMVE